jgi:hypothetical protein
MSATSSLSSQFLGQLLLPLQSMVNFFSPPVPSRASAALPSPAPAQPKPVVGTPLVGPALMGPQPKAQAPQVLRSRRAQDGRIVISGRMRDVCAELDRLCEDRA